MPQPRRTPQPPTSNVDQTDPTTEPDAGTPTTTEPVPAGPASETDVASSSETSEAAPTDDAPAADLQSVLNVSLSPVDLPSGAIVPPGARAHGVDLNHPEARRRIDSGELLRVNQENPS
jgi:hypothetical protein